MGQSGLTNVNIEDTEGIVSCYICEGVDNLGTSKVELASWGICCGEGHSRHRINSRGCVPGHGGAGDSWSHKGRDIRGASTDDRRSEVTVGSCKG